ncbi:DUF459 domain-containing protein [Chelatococcus sambhunathii]|uniref:DUF459 domain-containing protein n=1 Tax=Chelatococcus sambhunathii TaxID=363953 RepID=A0ABU1DGR6_9HYPH|nr:DUF459 domain-containing protein [Chelatococcus sambhunathii]MDR4307100.1 DUF459 domain-containing protein [Chelatococcus sambhunathii]
MKRLVLCALLALAAAAVFTPVGPGAQAQGWFDWGRSERRGYDDDAYDRRSRDRARQQARRARVEDDDRREPNFLQRLFGGGRVQNDDQGWRDREDAGAVEIRRKPRRVRRAPPPAAPAPALAATPPGTNAASAPGESTAPPPAPVAPTTFVAVIGDSIADNLAGGLEEGFTDAPELQVRRITKPNSGLVRSDYFDFGPAIQKALEAGPVTYAVFDVGVNDRQPFMDSRKDAPLSDEWKRRYAERIDAALAPFKERKIPIFWVGLAASEGRKATADHIAINALAKERVEAAGGTYVDVWEGFVDEDGAYADVGLQLDGQTGRLRLPDGVHFTRAGARKLAHYVEQEIRKIFQPKPATPEAVVAAVNPDPGAAAPQPGPAAEKPKPISSPVMVLTAPRRGADGALATAPMTIPARDASEQATRVLVKGEAPDADPGRMDDHRWPGAEQPKPAALMLDKAAPAEPVPASPSGAAPAPSTTDPRPTAQNAPPLQSAPTPR